MSPLSEQLTVELRRLGITDAPLQSLLEQVPQGLIVAEAPSGHVLFMSAQVETIFGGEPPRCESVEGYAAWVGFHEADLRPYAPDEWPLARAVRHGATVTGEDILIVRPDGERRWIRASASPILDQDGQVAAGMVVFVDVTGHKAAERRARALAGLAQHLAEARTASEVYRVIIKQGRQALDAYAGGIVTPEGNGERLRFIEAVGYPKHVLEAYRTFPADAPVPAAHAIRTGEPLFLDKRSWIERFQGPATATPTQSIAALPLRVGGRTVAALTLSFDAPRSFPAPEREFMRALADHCGQALERAFLYDREREARATAEAANRAKDDFLAVVSHELRTPLNAMAGWVAILKQQAGDAPALRRGIDALERTAALQARLVNDLLDLSRAATGKLQMRPERVQADAIARSTLESVRFAAEEHGVALRFELLGEGPYSLYADPSRLQQVLGNLLSNAVKFTPAHGTVTLALRPHARNLGFSVTDSGQGIEPGLLPFVFDRFRQGEGDTDQRKGGLGLGLAIVRHVVEAHHGAIFAESAGAGRGTRFTVLLPRCADAIPGGSAAPRDSPADLAGVEIVTLLSDDADSVSLAETLENGGATVRPAASAGAALQELEHRPAHVVLCDLAASHVEGPTFVRLLRGADSDVRLMPVAGLTAPSEGRPSASAPAVGCNTLIPKPADAEQLTIVLRALARSAG